MNNDAAGYYCEYNNRAEHAINMCFIDLDPQVKHISLEKQVDPK